MAASLEPRTTATHVMTATGTGTVAEQSITQSGPLGRLAGLVWHRLTTRYLAMEAQGLKQRSEQVVADAQSSARASVVTNC